MTGGAGWKTKAQLCWAYRPERRAVGDRGEQANIEFQRWWGSGAVRGGRGRLGGRCVPGPGLGRRRGRPGRGALPLLPRPGRPLRLRRGGRSLGPPGLLQQLRNRSAGPTVRCGAGGDAKKIKNAHNNFKKSPNLWEKRGKMCLNFAPLPPPCWVGETDTASLGGNCRTRVGKRRR